MGIVEGSSMLLSVGRIGSNQIESNVICIDKERTDESIDLVATSMLRRCCPSFFLVLCCVMFQSSSMIICYNNRLCNAQLPN